MTANWIAPGEFGTYDITVVVANSQGGEDTGSIALMASNGPSPVIEDVIVTAKGHQYLKETATGYTVLKTYAYDIDCIASGADGELAYEWSCDGGEISREGSMITWRAPDTAGDVTVTVVVTDVAHNAVSRSTILDVATCPLCFS
jgi:hypothetical protein